MLFTTISTSLVGYAAHNLQHLSLEELKLNNEVITKKKIGLIYAAIKSAENF